MTPPEPQQSERGAYDDDGYWRPVLDDAYFVDNLVECGGCGGMVPNSPCCNACAATMDALDLTGERSS
jgi:hypothetical protein